MCNKKKEFVGERKSILFLTKINAIHSFKLIEYINTM